MARRYNRKIDFKQWDGIPSWQQTISVDSTRAGSSLGFLIPATILRVRSRILISNDSPADTEQVNLAFGLGIVSSDAVAAGAGSLPDPDGEPEYPWLWWDDIAIQSFGGAVSPVEITPFGEGCREIIVDSKAMRKVKPGETLTWVSSSFRVAGTPTLSVMGSITRVLIGT